MAYFPVETRGVPPYALMLREKRVFRRYAARLAFFNGKTLQASRAAWRRAGGRALPGQRLRRKPERHGGRRAALRLRA